MASITVLVFLPNESLAVFKKATFFLPEASVIFLSLEKHTVLASHLAVSMYCLMLLFCLYRT